MLDTFYVTDAQTGLPAPKPKREQFERTLQTGPFRVQITDSTHQQILQGASDGTSPSVRRSGRPGDEKPFFVKGRIP